MALSQIQCLDDNHVNPRTHESKPEFLYCEDQRLALESLLRDGREAFVKFLEARGLRGFLSDPELEAFTRVVEPYDPGCELFPADAEDDEPPLSLHYWPELSDTSIPRLDLGWPDCTSYRGVTRANVYAQPSLSGEGHIKEIVRKAIAQAQKVIAVVMDIFTDVDIFRDLLDAGFKRKVSVYILLERTALPHFLSMCQRANMHTGHLKNLRVRCAGGADFYTRSSTMVRGRMGHRFMFIDGDKAVSGSYSFTWMSSRLDKHHITVVTGQAVDAFDRLFCHLYMTSSAVDLRQVVTETEPVPEVLPQPLSVMPPSAEVARKLYNPKYALLAIGNSSFTPTSSSGRNSPKDPNPQNEAPPETKRRRQRGASKEAVEAPPIHPGLANLERANLIPYLPTWPEPDPPSDVIGFINIRDANRPTQVHLQRSEMFETSQAIRFSSPVSMPEKSLPEVTKPTQPTAKNEGKREVQAKVYTKVSVEDRAQQIQPNMEPSSVKVNTQTPEEKAHLSGPNTHTAELKLGTHTHNSTNNSKSQPETETHREEAKMPALNTEHNLPSNTPSSQNISHNTTLHLNAHTPQKLNSDVSRPGYAMPHTVITNDTKPEPLPVLKTQNTTQTEPSLNTHSESMYSSHTLDSHSPQSSHPAGLSTDTENDSVPSTITPVPSSSISSMPTSSLSCLAVTSSSMNSDPPVTSVPSPPLPASSISTPPVPKPRTVQLVIKDSGGLDLPEVSVAMRSGSQASTGPLPDHNEPAKLPVTVALTQSGSDLLAHVEKENETVPTPQKESEAKNGVQTGTKNNLWKPAEGHLATQKTQSVTSQEREGICEALTGQQSDRKNRTAKQMDAGTKLQVQSDVLMASAPQTDHVNLKEITPRGAESKTLAFKELNIRPKPLMDCVTPLPIDTKVTARPPTGRDSSKAPSENVKQPKTELATAKEPQRILNCVLEPQNKSPLASVDSLTPEVGANILVSATHTHKHNPVLDTHTPKQSVDGTAPFDSSLHTHKSTHNTQDKSKHCTDNMLNTTKPSTHGAFQESQQNTNIKGSLQISKKSMYLHFPNSATNTPELRSPTPERDPRSHTPFLRTPTPDKLQRRTPTPDSRTHTPDPRSSTPDFRTPTSDLSDGYLSPREDSTLSNTSEEYYECSSSPLHDSVFDQVAYHSHRTTEDHTRSTLTNTATTAKPTPTSPVSIKTSTSSISYGASDNDMSVSDAQRLPGTSMRTSSSSLIDWKEKLTKEEGESTKENRGEDEDKEREIIVGERWNRTEKASRISQGTERGNSCLPSETKRTTNHFTEEPGTSEMLPKMEKNEDAKPQAPKRKRALTVGDDVVGGRANKPQESSKKGAETEELPTEFKAKEQERPEEVNSGGERAAETAALGPSSVERKDRLQPARDAKGKKPMRTPSRPPQWQQQEDSHTTPQSQPASPSRPVRRPGGGQPLNETGTKSSSPSRPPSRQSPPLAGRRQAEIPPAKRSPTFRQSQGRARAGQTQSHASYPKPQASFLHTHSNLQSQLQAQSQPAFSQMQTATQAQPGVRQGSAAVPGPGDTAGQVDGKSPFSLSFGRLYNLKGLKDKMSKPPPQSKRSSTSSPAQTRKSTG